MKTDRSSYGSDERPSSSSLRSVIDGICSFAYKRINDSTRQMATPVPIDADPTTKLVWIKKLISVLINSNENLEELLARQEESECGQYEHSLQKLEAQIRQHIAIEQQMRIHMDTLQEQTTMLSLQKQKLKEDLQKAKKKKKAGLEDELKTTRVRSSSSNILLRDKPLRLRSREKATENSKENSNLMNTNGSHINAIKKVKTKDAGRIRNCR